MAKKAAKKTTKKAAKKPANNAAKPAAKNTKKSTKKDTKKVAKKVTKKTTKIASAAKPKAAKTAAKKVTKKKTTAKKTKKVTKKTAASTSKKSTTKTSKKKTSKKTTSKKMATTKTPTASKTTTKKKTTKASANKESAAKDSAISKAVAGKESEQKKPEQKKFKSRSKKKTPQDYAPPPRPLLLGPGSKLTSGPLITSSKRSKATVKETKVSKRTKTPFTAKQLDDYRVILLMKRAELVGDVQNLEDEALRSSTGETQTASNAAEFGSESFEQGLNLDLAAADRQLILQIDEALARIADRTYGLCLETHEPIGKARLAELPWAKYSIAAARKMDQRFTR